MIKKIKDAFILHEPRDELKSAFTVLHAVFTRGVGLCKRVLEIGESKIAKNLLDDVRGCLVLKDLVVHVHCHEPEPRIHLSKVSSKARGCAALNKTSDHAIYVLLVAATW